MAFIRNITEYAHNETVKFTANLKEPDGSVISDPASQTVNIVFGAADYGAKIVSFNSSPQVVLADAASGMWSFVLTPANLSSLSEGTSYSYEIWSTNTNGEDLLQIKGEFVLGQSTHYS